MNPFSSWQFWAFSAAGFAALTAIFAKLGVEDLNPDLATFLRTLVVLAALGFILLATGELKSPGRLPPRSVVFLILSGLGTGASWVAYFRALKLGEAARVAPVDKLSVAMVAVLGTLLLGERLSSANWFGIAFIVLGAILVGFA